MPERKKDWRVRVRIHGGPPDTPNREDIAELVKAVGPAEVTQALADVCRERADELDDEIMHDASQGDVDTLDERRTWRDAHFLLEDAADRIRNPR